MSTTAPTQEFYYSHGVREAAELAFPIAPHNTWDSFVRRSYDAQNRLIQLQANALLNRGNITAAEAHHLVENQRNRLLLETRNRLSPPGRLYSELLKPSNSLPTLQRLLEQKGTIEAVLQSVGKTRQVVNRFSMVWRLGGPAVIIIDISFTAVIIVEAPPQDRRRVAMRETSGIVAAVGGGVAGAWAGCASAAMIASPSLVIPVVGKISTAGACVVGGVLGGVSVGWLGRTAGRAAGAAAYDLATDFRWTRR